MAGRLRLSRVGATLSGYYLDTCANWVLLGSGAISTSDVRLGMVAWSHDYFFGDQAVEVGFVNPSITADAFVGAGGIPIPLPDPVPVPEPTSLVAGALLLLPFAVGAAVRRRKA